MTSTHSGPEKTKCRINAAWGPRKESAEECSRKLLEYLRYLQGFGFETFAERGRSKKQAMSLQLQVEPAVIRALVERGVYRTDIGRRVMADLGFSVGLWAGRSDETQSYTLDVHCGLYVEAMFNTLELRFAESGKCSAEALGKAKLAEIFAETIQAWRPDCAILAPNKMEWRLGKARIEGGEGACLLLNDSVVQGSWIEQASSVMRALARHPHPSA